MSHHELPNLLEFLLKGVVLLSPLLIGILLAYTSTTYRENTVRGAGKIALPYVAVFLILFVSFITGFPSGRLRPDFIGFVVAISIVWALFASVYTLAVAAGGLKLGAYLHELLHASSQNDTLLDE